jgi:NMD protein affecting ribosome stability and mRNA decay
MLALLCGTVIFSPTNGARGELVSVECADRMYDLPKRYQVLWCSQCGTEFHYQPGSKWVTLIYIGFVDKQ